jgi:hypothetical protein
MRLSNTMLRAAASAFALASLALAGCSSATKVTDGGGNLVGADDSLPGRDGQSVLGSVPVGSILAATTAVNLRDDASTSANVLHVVPKGAQVTVVESDPSNGFYHVTHGGVDGWSFGKYYTLVSSPADGSGSPGGGTPDPSGGSGSSTGGSGSGSGGGSTSSSIADAMARAQAGVGFSYWWGHGRWNDGGPTSSTAGSCSGSCPSCSHSGSFGADCSGFVAKVWQVPSSNDTLDVDAHPYSTSTFVVDSSQWSTVSRGSVKQGDAMVYNSGGEGHIFLFESGDGWGSMWTYEARGCATGVVHNLRTASSAYHAIRRTGF